MLLVTTVRKTPTSSLSHLQFYSSPFLSIKIATLMRFHVKPWLVLITVMVLLHILNAVATRPSELPTKRDKDDMQSCGPIGMKIPDEVEMILFDYQGHPDEDCGSFDNQMAMRQLPFIPEKDLPSQCSLPSESAASDGGTGKSRKRRGGTTKKSSELAYEGCLVKKLYFSGNTRIVNEDPLFVIPGLCQVSNQIFINGLVENFYRQQSTDSIDELARVIIGKKNYISDRRDILGLFLNARYFRGATPSSLPPKSIVSLLKHCGVMDDEQLSSTKHPFCSALDKQIVIKPHGKPHDFKELSNAHNAQHHWSKMEKSFSGVYEAMSDRDTKWILPVETTTAYRTANHAVTFFLGQDADGRLFFAYFDINFGFTSFHIAKSGSPHVDHLVEKMLKSYKELFSCSESCCLCRSDRQLDHHSFYLRRSVIHFHSMNLRHDATKFSDNIKQCVDFMKNSVKIKPRKEELAEGGEMWLQKRMHDSFGFDMNAKTEHGVAIDVGLILSRPFAGLKEFEPYSSHFKENHEHVTAKVGREETQSDFVFQFFPFNDQSEHSIKPFKRDVNDKVKEFDTNDFLFYYFLVRIGLSENFIKSYALLALFSKFHKAVAAIERDFELHHSFCEMYRKQVTKLLPGNSKVDFTHIPAWNKLQDQRKKNNLGTITLKGYFSRAVCLHLLEHHGSYPGDKHEKSISTSVFGVLMMPFVVDYVSKLDHPEEIKDYSLYKAELYTRVLSEEVALPSVPDSTTKVCSLLRVGPLSLR